MPDQAEQEALLEAVLDTLIPPCEERGMPGAGALGLAGELPRDELGPVIDPGLQALGADFASSSLEARQARLEALSGEQPAFVPALLFHLYRCYYAQPAVLEALGMPGRPPHPEGYAMEENDLGLLAAVRARGRQYRDA